MTVRFPPLVLALGLGLVSATGFAPLDLWPLTLLSLAGWMHLVFKAETMKSALARGYWFGVGHFVLGLNWIAGSFRYQDAMPVWLGWIAVVVLSLYLAVYPALAAGLAWRWGKRRPRAGEGRYEDMAPDSQAGPRLREGDEVRFVLIFAAAWIVTEWLRATMFTGFAWNPLAAAFVDNSVVNIAPWIGTYGASGCVILIAALVGMFTVFLIQIARDFPASWRKAFPDPWRDGTWPTAIFGPLFLAALILFFIVGFVSGTTKRDLGTLGFKRITIIQPNIGQEIRNRGDAEELRFAALERLMRKDDGPRLIFWPEAAAPGFIEQEEWARERVAKLLGPGDVLLTGGDALVRDKDGNLIGARNSVFMVTPDAKLGWHYDKAHLVPYGEYLALRWLLEPLGATRLVPGSVDFLPGPGPRSFDVPGFGKAGIQICYEIIFSGQVVDRANRPDFLFNPSNDAWFGAWGPPQHFAQARLRAIEEGLPVIRATPTGVSGVIDANGNVLRALPTGAGAIDIAMPFAHSATLFARHGNVLPIAFALLLAALGVALRRKRR